MLRRSLPGVCAALLTGWLTAGAAVAGPVRTDAGVAVKVVVTKDTAVRERPDGGGRSRPLPRFSFLFLLDGPGAPRGRAGDHYRVGSGPADADFLGYVPAADALVWSHRQVVGFHDRRARDRVEFHATLNDLRTRLSGGAGRVVSREPERGGVRLLPILSRDRALLDGDEVAVYETAYLHAAGAAGRGGGERVDPAEVTLDVVFVIDTTGSMRDYIRGTKELVERIAQRLRAGGEGPRVRLGLVAYRDAGDDYVARTFCTLEEGTDPGVLARRLGRLEADGGGDDPEDLFAGVLTAVREAGWNPYAAKHVVVIADAPAKDVQDGEENRDDATLNRVAAAAQPGGAENALTRVTLNCVQVLPVDAANADDPSVERLRSQMETLSDGRDAPGRFLQYRRGGGTERYVRELSDQILATRTLMAGVIAGTVAPDAASADRTLGLGPVLELVETGRLGSGGGGGTEPEFARGFVAETDLAGNLAVDPYLLCSRDDLESFAGVLGLVVTRLRGVSAAERSTEKVVGVLQTSVLALSLDEPITADTTLAAVLRKAGSLPVTGAIFQTTPARLAAMSGPDFDRWVAGVDAALATVKGLLDVRTVWFELAPDAETGRAPQFAFLREAELP